MFSFQKILRRTELISLATLLILLLKYLPWLVSEKPEKCQRIFSIPGNGNPGFYFRTFCFRTKD